MNLISKADVVLALGTRLNPFSTLPCYGIDYWPNSAKVIQVDINPDRLGLSKKITLGRHGQCLRADHAEPNIGVPAFLPAQGCDLHGHVGRGCSEAGGFGRHRYAA